MKNQHKVISILVGIVLSEGVFAEPNVGELNRQTLKSKQAIPSTDPVWKPEQQLAAQPSNGQGSTKTPAELFEIGQDYLQSNSSQLGITTEQVKAYNNVINYRVSEINNSLSKSALDALNQVDIGGVNLKEYIVSVESYANAIDVFNDIPDSSVVSEQLMKNHSNVDFSGKSEIINDNTGYDNTKKAFGIHDTNLLGTLGSSIEHNEEMLGEAAMTAYDMSKAVIGPNKLKAIQAAYSGIKSTAFIVKAVNIAQLGYKQDKASLIEMLNNLATAYSEVESSDNKSGLAGFGAAALQLTNDIALMKTIANIDKRGLSSAGSEAIDMAFEKLMLQINESALGIASGLATMAGMGDFAGAVSSVYSLFANTKFDELGRNLASNLEEAKTGKDTLDSFTNSYVSATKSVVIAVGFSVQKEKESIEKASKEKNNQLITKSIDIKEEENVLVKKQKELDDKKKELANTNKYINNLSNNTQTSYDQRKLAYLQAAKNLFDKYGNKPRPDWSASDQLKLKTLAEKLGIERDTLFAELRLGHFNSLRDKYASISTVSGSVETIENLDYKNIESQISNLTGEIKPLNQKLTLDKMQQADLKMSADNLRDATNTIKVTETQNNVPNAPAHESYWAGGYTENLYYENNLGEPVNSGFGDGPAEFGSPIIDQGDAVTMLYPPPSSGVNHVEVLNQSPSAYLGSYNYVAWGTWSDPNRASFSKVYTSHWVLVDQIDRDQKPKSGTATYTGELRGTLWTIGQDNSYHNANGDITMDADFAKNSINGTLNVRNADNLTSFAEKVKFDTTMSSTADGDGLKFQGTLTGDGISKQQEFPSQISGEFGGDQAAEAGGTWAITKTDSAQIAPNGQATGVFRAEK